MNDELSQYCEIYEHVWYERTTVSSKTCEEITSKCINCLKEETKFLVHIGSNIPEWMLK